MAAVTLSMLLVAIHFETAGGLGGVWQEDGSAGPGWKEPNMAVTTAGLPGKHAPPTNIHEHFTCPSITAGGGGAAPPIKIAQVLRLEVWLVTAAQP